MIIFAITGPMASGKSFITRVLRGSFSIPVFDADGEVKSLLKTPEIQRKIMEFDPSISRPDRTFLRSWVRNSPQNLAFLENLLHPLILEKIGSFVRMHQSCRSPMIALDIPLLFECGWEGLCDYIILSDVGEHVQKYRLMARGYTKDDMMWRSNRMMPQSYKKKHADFIISSDVGFRYAFEQLREIIKLHAPNRS